MKLDHVLEDGYYWVLPKAGKWTVVEVINGTIFHEGRSVSTVFLADISERIKNPDEEAGK